MFLLPCLALLASSQSAEPGPVAKVGTSGEFQRTLKQALQSLETGDFAKASGFARQLPQKTIVVTWDATGLDPQQKSVFLDAAQSAVNAWQTAVPELSIKFGQNGAVKLAFVKNLPPPVGQTLPQGMVTFVSDDPSEPRIEAVIALKRLDPPISIDPPIVAAEVAYAIGSYLGLERDIRNGMVMTRTDGLGAMPVSIDVATQRLVRENLAAAAQVAQAAKSKTRLRYTAPEVFVQPTSWTKPDMHQGVYETIRFDIVNRGTSDLEVDVRPDCSCFLLEYERRLAPGQTSVVTAYMDTTLFMGDTKKTLFVYTNDPERPVTPISVSGHIIPAYRVLAPASQENPTYVGDAGTKLTFYVVPDPKQFFRVTSATVSGGNAIADVTPWEGTLPDPEFGQGDQARKGWKVEVLVSPTSVNGRAAMTLSLATDSKPFATIFHNFAIQRGFAVSPRMLYFGEVPAKPQQAWFTVSRKGRPFSVTRAASSDARFVATPEKLPNGDYKVSVRFDGKATAGVVQATIYLTTDDPAFPTIEVPVQVIVR